MKFAYADPPYPGQAARWYRDHPDYGGEVDHAELVTRLCRDYPDGWALSTSASGLQQVLALCPADVRIAIWHRTDSEHPGNRGRWHRSWEPVIVWGGRAKYGDGPTVRDVLSVAAGANSPAHRIAGAKPPAFSQWIFMLLGARPGDDLDDLFPGSGAVERAWKTYQSQGVLTGPPRRQSHPERVARDWARAGVPGLWEGQP